MAGFTQATAQALLDYKFPTSGATNYIAYSTDGSTESSLIARTAVGATGWAAATAAMPSVKANNGALTSAAASGSGTITHFAIYDASTAGNQITQWVALATGLPVIAGTTIAWATGNCSVTLD